MANTRVRVEYALQEARILVIGSQLLIGLLFRSIFETGFEHLQRLTQLLLVAGLGLMLVALALLQTSAAFHRIAEKGEDTERLRTLVGTLLRLVLACFVLGLAITGYAAGEKLLGTAAGLAAGLLIGLVAVFLWYGWPESQRKRITLGIGDQEMDQNEAQNQGTPLEDKIRHVLTETRVVLPGAQALLGFQFVSMLTEAFEKLPASSKSIHLVSLLLVALSTVLLMTPAAYHRIAEHGLETDSFHKVASRLLLASMIPLPLGVTGDFYVVALKVTKSAVLSGIAAGILLLLFYGLWFGFPLMRRSR